MDYLEILLTAGMAIGFTLFITFIGAPAVTKMAPRIDRLRVDSRSLYLDLGCASDYRLRQHISVSQR